jgi:hypothetical protein
MTEQARLCTAVEIANDVATLDTMAANHSGFPGRPDLEIALHHARATYILAEQFAALREIVEEVTPRPSDRTVVHGKPISTAELERLEREHIEPRETASGAAPESAQGATSEQAAADTTSGAEGTES